MKLLQRLRSMSPAAPPSSERTVGRALPDTDRNDFRAPPAKESLEPILGKPSPGSEPRRSDFGQR